MTDGFRFDEYFPAFFNPLTPDRFPLKLRRTRPLEWPEPPFHKAQGEAALWAAVITQALMDALSRATHAETIYFKHEATLWLTGNSRDFRMVCECAGFDPGYIRRMAKRALGSPRRWRAGPGHGPRYLERRQHRRRMKEEKSQRVPARHLQQDLTRCQLSGTAYALA